MNKINLKPVEIAYGADESDSGLLLLSLETLIERSNKERNYHIHILTSGLSEKVQERILSLTKLNVSFYFHDVHEWARTALQDAPLGPGESLSDYYRFCAAEYFLSIDKLLYLGTETFFCGDLSVLYDQKLGKKEAYAFKEGLSKNKAFFSYYANGLLLSPKKVFSSAVLLMNLKRMRQEKFMDRFLLEKDFYSFQAMPVNEYLNLVLEKKVGYFSSRYFFETVLNKEKEDKKTLLLSFAFEKKFTEAEKDEMDYVYLSSLSPTYALVRYMENAAREGKETTDNHLDEILSLCAKEEGKADSYADRVRELKKCRNGMRLEDLFFVKWLRDHERSRAERN